MDSMKTEVGRIAKKLGLSVDLEEPKHQCTAKRAWMSKW